MKDGGSMGGLRVCHLGKYYPPARGGMETHLQVLARAQAALGADVRVVCVNHETADGRPRPTPTRNENDGPVRVTRVGRWATLAGLDLCPALPRLLRAVARERPDVVHLHTPNPTMLLPLVFLWPEALLVITHHSDVIRQKVLRHLTAPFDFLIYRRAARVLTTSPLYAEGSALLRRHAAKVETLPLGIDLSAYLRPSEQARTHARGLREVHGEPLWLMVGRLIYYKGLDVALEALTRVPGTLLVIGTGPLEAPLKGRAEALGLARRVVWKGRADADELVGAFQAATAFWFPSNARSEAFGLVQVEAMASGRPVINTAIPASGVPWVSRHEETGLTVPVNDAEALAAAARRLLTEPGLRERLGTRGRAWAQQHFDHGPMARRSLEIYRRALDRVTPHLRPVTSKA